MTDIIMFDAIDLAQIPVGPAAAAGYVDGKWQTFPELAARYPNARLLSIAVSAEHDADCLDVETGDATPADVPGWYARQRARGTERPCIYASASVMEASVIPLVRSGAIARPLVRLWSAHYSGVHICSASSCGAVSIPVDGTQWTDRAWGRPLDESLLLADFFTAATAKPAPSPAPDPVPAWQEAIMNKLPVLQEGAKDTAEPWMVRRVQALCNALGTPCTLDGDFGAATKAAVEAVQHDHSVTADGIVGPATWSVLVTGSAP